MNLLIGYYNLKRLNLFIGIVLANMIIIWLSKTVLINEIVFYNTYSEQLTYDRSMKLFEFMKRISWISYILAPLLLLLKVTIISLVVYSGIVFFNLHQKVNIGSVFKVVIASELVFVFAGYIKFLWFYFLAGNYDLNDIGFFYPLSLINLFNSDEISRIWIFPFQTLNLFHLLYLVSISFGLNKVCEIEKGESEKIVLFSYLPALIFWVSLVIFLTMDYAI